ncbi:MAG: PolC-type DNA polymerase III [Bacilli bacterium]
MDDKLVRFFNKINFNNEYIKYFKDSVITKVDVIKDMQRWVIHMNMDKSLPIEIFSELTFASRNIDNVKRVDFVFTTKELLYAKEYFFYYFDKLILACPNLCSVRDNVIEADNNLITIEVLNKTEEDKINSLLKLIKTFMVNMGYININIDVLLNHEKRKKFQEEMKKRDVLVPISTTRLVYGSKISGKTLRIKNCTIEESNVVFEAFVFGKDVKKIPSGLNIFSFKISDYSDSINGKMFIKNEGDSEYLLKNINVSSWYRFGGYIKYDSYEKDLVFNIRDIETIEKRSNKRVDEAKEKRVELHIHSIMSQMDGLIRPDKLLKKVRDLGFRGFGITDKNCIQVFPKLYKDAGDLKILYGTELFCVDDTVLISTHPSEYSLKSEFIVFDLETTGLNAGAGDSIIEIGAVKIKDNEIISRFDMLIDPKVPLREIITKITNITDDMLKDKPSEEEAIKEFIKYIKDTPLVAHNAKFDVSFIESAFRKYNKGTFKNVVLDTMELSKALSPDEKKHNLTVCAKRWGVKWSEDEHHRADYDAEATGYIFNKMISSLSSNYKTINDLDNLINKDLIYKNNLPFHMTVYAINNVGLKNLFKVISYANTKYFFRTPRILKSELVKYREGLIFGSGCINGEIFEASKTKGEEDLINLMMFYDFIEVNPPSIQTHLIEKGEFSNMFEVKENIKKIINAALSVNKLVCATGDVHTLDPEDNIYREILVNQKASGGGLHPLCRSEIKTIPNAYLMTTNEMLEEFNFLDESLAKEIVIDNPNKVLDMSQEVTVLKDGLFSPKMENSVETIKELVYANARGIYGDVLPEIIETRLEKELGGIIGGGYDVIYLIAQKLVKKSNDDGYIVGSRGSVGSSLVATFLNITEVNPLPPHYVCPKCKKSIFEEDGKLLSDIYGSGFDMPDKLCSCGLLLKKNGQDIPFETFLGFNADKTPDIDLNFSGEYQANAHNYTKVLFGEAYVFRAGTVTSIAEKTAYGFVKGYTESKGLTLRRCEIERLAQGITGIKRTSGQHPGGIIVIPDYKDVFDFTPYQYPAENTEASWYTTHFEFHDIEPNVLKLDILGHDDPTVLKYLSDDVKIDINDIPLDDKEVMSLFSSSDSLKAQGNIKTTVGTLGVPEFGTSFVMKLLEETRPQTFAELIKISGLSHGTGVWAGNAREVLINKVCEFKDVIGCRDDIMIYFIKCGIDKGQAFKMSEFIRKGKVKKDPDKWIEFKQILQENKVPSWYIGCCEKIEYMFPKAHASAYVTNGFRVAWFKLHHPLEYYRVYLSIRGSDFDIETIVKGRKEVETLLTSIEEKGYEASTKETNTYSTLLIINELFARGFFVENISLEKSDAKMFIINDNHTALIPPFMTLDGLGENAAKKIVEERNNKPFISIEDLQKRGKVGTTIIDKLTLMGCLNDLPESSQLSLF